MMYLITAEHFGECFEVIRDMHRLRYRVFKERLDWEVEVSGDMEIDRFDALKPAYLVCRDDGGRIQGCVRLLPTTGATMLAEAFPVLLGDQPMPRDPKIWESSRFCLDLEAHSPMVGRGISQGFCELCCGMIEFGLSRNLSEIVTVTDIRVERLAKAAGWPLRRLAEPRALGRTRAVAIFLEISGAALRRVRETGRLGSPTLWEPVPLGRAA